MVDRLVPQQYSTLQAALNASVSGDHVKIRDSHTTGQANLGNGAKNNVTISGVDSNGTVITKQMVDAGVQRPLVQANSNALINATASSNTIIQGLDLLADWTNPSGANGNGGNGTVSFFPSSNVALDCIIRNCKIMAGGWHVAAIQQNNGANRLTLEDLELTSVPGGPPLGAYSPLGASCFSNFGPVIVDGGSAASNWLRVRRVKAHNCIQWGSSEGIGVTRVTDGNGFISESSNAGSNNFQNLFEDCLAYDCGGDAFNFFRWSNAGTTRIINTTSYRLGLTAGLTNDHPAWNGGWIGSYPQPSQPAYNGTQAAFAAGFAAGGSTFIVSNCVMIRGGSGSTNVFNSMNGGTNGNLIAECNTRSEYNAWGATVGANNIDAGASSNLQLANIGARDFHPATTSPLVNSGCASTSGNVPDTLDQECKSWGGFATGRGALAPTGVIVDPCDPITFPNQCPNVSWDLNLQTAGGVAPFTYTGGDGDIDSSPIWHGDSTQTAGGTKTVFFTDGQGRACQASFNVVDGPTCTVVEPPTTDPYVTHVIG